MKKRKKYLKCDFVGDIFSSGIDASASIYSAQIAAEASQYAADKSYEGQVATNNAQIQIANDLNRTNMENVRATNEANLTINQQTNQANKGLAQMQNQWNIEQWNRENAYNSPAHQVQLYRQAGLNPAGLSGGNSWTPAANVQSANLANQQGIQLQAPQATAMPNLVNPAEQSSMIEAQGALAKAQMTKSIVRDALSAGRAAAALKSESTSAKYIKDMKVATLKQMAADTAYTISQKKSVDKMTPLKALETYANIGFINMNRELVKAKIGESSAYTDLMKIQQRGAALQYEIMEKSKDYLIGINQAQYEQAIAKTWLTVEQWKRSMMDNVFYEQNGLPPELQVSLWNTVYASNSQLEGTKYSADKSLEGTKYSADKSLEGVKYGADSAAKQADLNRKNQIEIAKMNNLNSKQIAEMNNKRGWFSTVVTGIVAAGGFYLTKGHFGKAMRMIKSLEKGRKAVHEKLLRERQNPMATPYN